MKAADTPTEGVTEFMDTTGKPGRGTVPVLTTDTQDERARLESALIEHRRHLQELPPGATAVDRARVELEIAAALLGLGRGAEAWEPARRAFDAFVAAEHWAEAVEAADILYQTDQAESLVALGNGLWLAVTYPIPPELSVRLLHHVVEETPDHSDGGAVAAVAAHYIADLRGEGREKEDLIFLTGQVVAEVAKRHRGIEDPESIDVWVEMLELNNPDVLFERLGRIVDVIVDGKWWYDREALRARLPVN